MGQVSQELSNRLTAAVERMPAFPKSVQRILELTRDINCSPKELVAVIETDPVIAIKILKIVNSAYFSLPSKISSINQSVVYLGLNTLKNLALNFSTIGMLPRQNAAGFDMQGYLLHSLLTAGLTRSLSERFAGNEADPTDAYTVGLLHNFGKVVFAQFMPQEFRQALALSAADGIPLHHAEERIIGADHALVGAMLARHWQFSNSLAECIAGHHHGSGDGALAECLHVADLIAEQLSSEPVVAVEEIDSEEELPPRFGGGLGHVVAAVRDLDDMIEKANVFCHAEAFK
ncbi:MAG TPA: HDOD domain-containing protein [Paucimonas sp.]|nr:HDOD domain-containing protein [Paucimonas sp.]